MTFSFDDLIDSGIKRHDTVTEFVKPIKEKPRPDLERFYKEIADNEKMRWDKFK